MTTDNLQLFKLLLDCYRAPLQNAYCGNPQRELPDDFAVVLEGLVESSVEGGHFDAAGATLGVSITALREAGLFFIKQVLFDEQSNHYRVLGLAPGASLEDIRRHYRLLIRLFHPDKNPEGEDWDQQYAPRINEAYNVLKRPEKRQSYDAQLLKRAYASPAPTGPQRQAPPPMRRQQVRHFSTPQVLAKSAAWQRHPKLVVTGVFLVGLILVLMSTRSSDEGTLLRETGQEEMVADIQPQLMPEPDAVPEVKPVVAQQAALQIPEQQMDKPEVEIVIIPSEPLVVSEPEVEIVIIPAAVVKLASVAPPSRPKQKTKPKSEPKPKSKPKPEPKPKVAAVKPEPMPQIVEQPRRPVSTNRVAELSDVASSSFMTNPKPDVVASAKPKQKPKKKPKKKLGVQPQPKPKPVPAQVQPALSWEPEQVLLKYIDMYRVGDLMGVLNLFTSGAKINTGSGLGAIAEHYDRLFRDTVDRRIVVADIEQTMQGLEQATMLIYAEIRELPASGGEWTSSVQKLEMHVVQRKDGLFISQLTSSK